MGRFLIGVLGAVLAVAAMGGCLGAQGASQAQLVAERISTSAEHWDAGLAELSGVVRDLADAAAVVKPTSADDVDKAAESLIEAGQDLRESAGIIARAAESVSETLETSEDLGPDEAAQIAAAVVQAGGTLATGNPAAGAALGQAAYSTTQILAAIATALGLGVGGAGWARRRENAAWDEAFAKAKGTGGP